MSIKQAMELLDRPEAQPLPWAIYRLRRRVVQIALSLAMIGDDLARYGINPCVARAIREWAGPAWACPICGDQNCEGFCDDD